MKFFGVGQGGFSSIKGKTGKNRYNRQKQILSMVNFTQFCPMGKPPLHSFEYQTYKSFAKIL